LDCSTIDDAELSNPLLEKNVSHTTTPIATAAIDAAAIAYQEFHSRADATAVLSEAAVKAESLWAADAAAQLSGSETNGWEADVACGED
jgi:hypothetical protein